jgi:hypothetical protein
MYETLEAQYGLVFEEAMTPDMKLMRLTLDPLEHSYRPLLGLRIPYITQDHLWSFVESCRLLLLSHLHWLTILVSGIDPKKTESSMLPLLFLHGIAPGGLALYLPMLLYLGRYGRSLLFFENAGISFGVQFGNPPNEERDHHWSLEAVVKHLGSTCDVSVVGHYFISCPITWSIHSFGLAD